MTCSNSRFVYRGNSEAELERLLGDRLDHPDQCAVIDRSIREQFIETYAVLVLDSSGFSRNCQQDSIIAALAEVERMRRVIVPLFQHQGGRIFKVEVDNIYAVFPDVTEALTVAQETLEQLTPLGIHVSIGIGYGELLMIAEQDHYSNVYGIEMNLASKLGEDVAGANEIWLTEAAFHRLNAPPDAFEGRTIPISGLDLRAYRSFCSYRHT